jgi:hypothetical protein
MRSRGVQVDHLHDHQAHMIEKSRVNLQCFMSFSLVSEIGSQSLGTTSFSRSTLVTGKTPVVRSIKGEITPQLYCSEISK